MKHDQKQISFCYYVCPIIFKCIIFKFWSLIWIYYFQVRYTHTIQYFFKCFCGCCLFSVLKWYHVCFFTEYIHTSKNIFKTIVEPTPTYIILINFEVWTAPTALQQQKKCHLFALLTLGLLLNFLRNHWFFKVYNLFHPLISNNIILFYLLWVLRLHHFINFVDVHQWVGVFLFHIIHLIISLIRYI